MQGLFLNIAELCTVIEAINFLNEQGYNGISDSDLKDKIKDYFESIGYEH